MCLGLYKYNFPPQILSSSFIVNERSCKNTRFTKHLVKGANTPPVYTHSNCSCNEVIAFRMRHQTNGTHRVNNVALPITSQLRHSMNNIIKELHTTFKIGITALMSFDEIILKYHGRHRLKYEHAKCNILKFGIQPKHFTNKCFLKDDKYHLNDFDGLSVPKPPRAIQYQSGEATLFKAQWIIPIEKKFYDQLDRHSLPIFTKNLNNNEIAALFLSSIDAIPNYVIVENDFASFDASVCVELLKIFRRFVLKSVPSSVRKRARWAMRFDDCVKGYTMRGNKYKTIGTVTSGSIDTSFKGNFINYLATTSILRHCGIPESHYKFICNGDDSILILDRSIMHKYQPQLYTQFGLNSKTKYVDSIFEAEFCQSRIVQTPIGFTMCRNPQRIFTRLGWMVGNRTRYPQDYLKTILMGEMALNYMVPVLYPILYKLYNKINGRVNLRLVDSYTSENYVRNHWMKNVPYIYHPSWDVSYYNVYSHPLHFSLDKPDHVYDSSQYALTLACYGL